MPRVFYLMRAGRTVGPPMNGQEKARAVSSYANVWGVPLERCAAYGDSRGDAEMLRAVGAPLAVNPDSGLKKRACAPLGRPWNPPAGAGLSAVPMQVSLCCAVCVLSAVRDLKG